MDNGSPRSRQRHRSEGGSVLNHVASPREVLQNSESSHHDRSCPTSSPPSRRHRKALSVEGIATSTFSAEPQVSYRGEEGAVMGAESHRSSRSHRHSGFNSDEGGGHPSRSSKSPRKFDGNAGGKRSRDSPSIDEAGRSGAPSLKEENYELQVDGRSTTFSSRQQSEAARVDRGQHSQEGRTSVDRNGSGRSTCRMHDPNRVDGSRSDEKKSGSATSHQRTSSRTRTAAKNGTSPDVSTRITSLHDDRESHQNDDIDRRKKTHDAQDGSCTPSPRSSSRHRVSERSSSPRNHRSHREGVDPEEPYIGDTSGVEAISHHTRKTHPEDDINRRSKTGHGQDFDGISSPRSSSRHRLSERSSSPRIHRSHREGVGSHQPPLDDNNRVEAHLHSKSRRHHRDGLPSSSPRHQHRSHNGEHLQPSIREGDDDRVQAARSSVSSKAHRAPHTSESRHRRDNKGRPENDNTEETSHRRFNSHRSGPISHSTSSGNKSRGYDEINDGGVTSSREARHTRERDRERGGEEGSGSTVARGHAKNVDRSSTRGHERNSSKQHAAGSDITRRSAAGRDKDKHHTGEENGGKFASEAPLKRHSSEQRQNHNGSSSSSNSKCRRHHHPTSSSRRTGNFDDKRCDGHRQTGKNYHPSSSRSSPRIVRRRSSSSSGNEDKHDARRSTSVYRPHRTSTGSPEHDHGARRRSRSRSPRYKLGVRELEGDGAARHCGDESLEMERGDSSNDPQGRGKSPSSSGRRAGDGIVEERTRISQRNIESEIISDNTNYTSRYRDKKSPILSGSSSGGGSNHHRGFRGVEGDGREYNDRKHGLVGAENEDRRQREQPIHRSPTNKSVSPTHRSSSHHRPSSYDKTDNEPNRSSHRASTPTPIDPRYRDEGEGVRARSRHRSHDRRENSLEQDVRRATPPPLSRPGEEDGSGRAYGRKPSPREERHRYQADKNQWRASTGDSSRRQTSPQLDRFSESRRDRPDDDDASQSHGHYGSRSENGDRDWQGYRRYRNFTDGCHSENGGRDRHNQRQHQSSIESGVGRLTAGGSIGSSSPSSTKCNPASLERGGEDGETKTSGFLSPAYGSLRVDTQGGGGGGGSDIGRKSQVESTFGVTEGESRTSG